MEGLLDMERVGQKEPQMKTKGNLLEKEENIETERNTIEEARSKKLI